MPGAHPEYPNITENCTITIVMLSCKNQVIGVTALRRLAPRVQQYLNETLGIPAVASQTSADQEALPYFLREAFELRRLDIAGTPVVLAMDRHPGSLSLREIRGRLQRIRAVTGIPVVYVTDALASYERRHLIAQKVPFIVPGNQLYLPDLGLDLREYFRRPAGAAESPLSPSTQAILIAALLRRRWKPEWRPADTAAALGYTPMTLSRAVRELMAAGLVQAHKSGRTRYLIVADAPRRLWERARPLLRSPVQRTVWTTAPLREEAAARLAGLSALAQRSLLAEPRTSVYAILRTRWTELGARAGMSDTMPGTQECQLWRYSPALEPGSCTVDPLSLILSFDDPADERVQAALDTLTEQLPW